MLRFADGQAEPVDLIAFADGRSSIGRRLLDPDRALHYAGYIAHRGDTPATPTDLCDFRRLEPCPGVRFNIAPIPTGSDWTFYLNATADQYTAWFGAHPCGESSPCRTTSAKPAGSGSTRTPQNTCPPTTPPWSTPPGPGWRCR